MEDRIEALETRIEQQDEMMRAMMARLFATSQATELLLAVHFARAPLVQEALKTHLRGRGDPGKVLTDHAAEWWADVEIQREQMMEAMIARAETIVKALHAAGAKRRVPFPALRSR